MDEALHPITNLLIEMNRKLEDLDAKLTFLVRYRGLWTEFQKQRDAGLE